MNTVYKVVRKVGDEYFSVAEKNPFELKYSQLEKTLPKIGKIFACATYDAASYLCSQYGEDACIFEAEAELSRVTLDRCLFPEFFDFIVSFWDNISVDPLCQQLMYDETVLCNSLKLIKRV